MLSIPVNYFVKLNNYVECMHNLQYFIHVYPVYSCNYNLHKNLPALCHLIHISSHIECVYLLGCHRDNYRQLQYRSSRVEYRLPLFFITAPFSPTQEKVTYIIGLTQYKYTQTVLSAQNNYLIQCIFTCKNQPLVYFLVISICTVQLYL